jgi:hypothetical protein
MDNTTTAAKMAGNDTGDSYSEISDHYTVVHPELANSDVPTMKQASAPGNFKRLTMSANISFAEAFPGAFNVAVGLNAEIYAVPYGVGPYHLPNTTILTDCLVDTRHQHQDRLCPERLPCHHSQRVGDS